MPEDVSAQAVLDQLRSIFPDFNWEADDDEEILTLHGLMHELLYFWGNVASKASEAQAKGLASFLNDAIAQGGVLGNAADTCFLEHLSQVRARKPLAKFLSPAAKSLGR